MQFEIPCPSGAVLEFKEIGGPQIIAIAERVGSNASGETIAAILSGCCTAVIEAGPYSFLKVGRGSPDWTKMLYGDVITALLWLRVKSFPAVGADYDYTFSCEHCGTLGGATHDLVGLLEDSDANRVLSPEAYATIEAGEPFRARCEPVYQSVREGGAAEVRQVELVPPISVTFDLHRLAQDVAMRAQMKRADRKKITTIEQVATQLKSVDGLFTAKHNEPVKDLFGLWRWAQVQSGDTLDNLLAQFRAADCGVDPMVHVRCNGDDGCGREQMIALPFGKSFFSPRAGATKKASTTKPASFESSSQG